MLRYGSTGLLLLLLSVLAAAALTGRTQRAYPVLAQEATVNVAGKAAPVAQWAEVYRPEIYLRSATPSPELLWVWYEAVPAGPEIRFVYYHAWANEVHPNAIFHALYAGYRAAYFGYPLYDIEFFQVTVDRRTGEVQGLRFETGMSTEYFQPFPEHVTVRYTLASDGTYGAVFTTPSGGERRRPAAPLVFDGTRVRVGVQTWNHLVHALERRDEADEVLQEAPLRYLTDADYRRHKFVRKSQGDSRTEESPWTLPLAAMAVFFCMAWPAWLLRSARLVPTSLRGASA